MPLWRLISISARKVFLTNSSRGANFGGNLIANCELRQELIGNFIGN